MRERKVGGGVRERGVERVRCEGRGAARHRQFGHDARRHSTFARPSIPNTPHTVALLASRSVSCLLCRCAGDAWVWRIPSELIVSAGVARGRARSLPAHRLCWALRYYQDSGRVTKLCYALSVALTLVGVTHKTGWSAPSPRVPVASLTLQVVPVGVMHQVAQSSEIVIFSC